MHVEKGSSTEHAAEDALRRLVADPRTRAQAVEAIDASVASSRSPERQAMRVLAHLNRERLVASVRRLDKTDFGFDDVRDDSPAAHAKMADVQRILSGLGFDVGPDGVDGYSGGPPGPPVVMDHDEIAKLTSRGAGSQKLLSIAADGGAESWTRDATRRLQHFLGTVGLPADRTDLRRDCLARPDGLFGRLTLEGLKVFLGDAGVLR